MWLPISKIFFHFACQPHAQNFYILKIHVNSFEISNRVLKFENLKSEICQQIQNKPESNNILHHCLLHSSSRLEKAHLKFKVCRTFSEGCVAFFLFPRSKQSKIDWILSALKGCEVSSKICKKGYQKKYQLEVFELANSFI